MSNWSTIKKLAAYVETEQIVLLKYCCPECIEDRNQVSDHDYYEMQYMVTEYLKDPMAQTDAYKLKDIIKGKVYEYLFCAGYEQYDLSRWNLENQHLLPLWIERRINKALGTGPCTIKTLYCKRTFFERLD